MKSLHERQRNTEAVDGLRAYVKTIMLHRGVTQEELADEVGYSRRGLSYWLSGRTQEIRIGNLIRVILALRASFEDVQYLIDTAASPEKGVEMASALFAREKDGDRAHLDHTEEKDRVSRALELIQTMTKEEIIAFFARLQNEAQQTGSH